MERLPLAGRQPCPLPLQPLLPGRRNRCLPEVSWCTKNLCVPFLGQEEPEEVTLLREKLAPGLWFIYIWGCGKGRMESHREVRPEIWD